jgi:ankyrin repeat protein
VYKMAGEVSELDEQILILNKPRPKDGKPSGDAKPLAGGAKAPPAVAFAQDESKSRGQELSREEIAMNRAQEFYDELCRCIRDGKIDLFIDKMAEADVDLNALDSSGHTPMYYAIKNFSLKGRGEYTSKDLVEFLCEKGADIECENWVDNVPVVVAAKYGNLDALQYLVEEQVVDVDHFDGSGWCPIAYAVQNRNVAMMEYLLNQAGAAVNIVVRRFDAKTGQKEEVPLLILGKETKNMNIISLLKSKDCRMPEKDADGKFVRETLDKRQVYPDDHESVLCSDDD